MGNIQKDIPDIERRYWTDFGQYMEIIHGKSEAFKTWEQRLFWADVSRRSAVQMGNRLKKLAGQHPARFTELKKKTLAEISKIAPEG